MKKYYFARFFAPDDGGSISGGASASSEPAGSFLGGAMALGDASGNAEQQPAAVPASAPAAQPAVGSSIIDASGNLMPGWKNLLPPELQGEKTLENFKDLKGLASALVSTKRLVGDKTVKLPGENSSEQDWNEFYKTLGRPDAPEAYKITRDAALPEGLRENKYVDEFKNTFHQLGLTQQQVDGIMQKYDAQLKASMGDMQQQKKRAIAETAARLKQDWGADYEKNFNLAQMAWRQLDPEEEFDKNGLGNHPSVVKLLAKVAPMVLGDKIVNGHINEGVNAIEEELSGIRNNPAYMNEMHADHSRLVQRHNALMQQRAMLRQR